VINWNKLTAEDVLVISRILKRATAPSGFSDQSRHSAYQTLDMDLQAAHINDPLDLEALEGFPDLDFFHDVVGICSNINRETGELMNCFVPRCAKKAERKDFDHACQPYGTVKLKDAFRREVEVPVYSNGRKVEGKTRKTMRVTGTVVDSLFRSFFGGVAISNGRQKYPVGYEYSVDGVSDHEWKTGIKISVAM